MTSRDHPAPPAEVLLNLGSFFDDFSTHDVDTARWLLGEDPSEIYAVGSGKRSVPCLCNSFAVSCCSFAVSCCSVPKHGCLSVVSLLSLGFLADYKGKPLDDTAVLVLRFPVCPFLSMCTFPSSQVLIRFLRAAPCASLITLAVLCKNAAPGCS